MSTLASASVARIAILTSDVVLDSLPAAPAQSAFSTTYSSLTASVKSVPRGADIASLLAQSVLSASLATLTLSAPDAATITRLLPALPALADSPIVIHVAASSDLADVLSLRSAVPYVLYSNTQQQAHDQALLAARIASTEKKIVLHIFQTILADQDASFVEIEEALVEPFLTTPSRASPALNGTGLPNGNGHSNGNGAQSGHSRSHSVSSGGDEGSDSTSYRGYESAALATLALVRRPVRPSVYSGPSHPETLVVSLGSFPTVIPADITSAFPTTGFLSYHAFRPLPASRILASIPSSTKRIIVLEQIYNHTVKFTPLYLDFVAALQSREDSRPEVISGTLGEFIPSNLEDSIRSLLENPTASPLLFGSFPTSLVGSTIPAVPHVPAHESSYTSLLKHLFSSRIDIINSPSLVPSAGEDATRPEFALGRAKAMAADRELLIAAVKDLLSAKPEEGVSEALHRLLSAWLNGGLKNPEKSSTLATEIIPLLAGVQRDSAREALRLQSHFGVQSRWIVGSDAWSYDLGASGFHHLVSSGLNVNILLLDTQPYSTRASADPARRKKDAGLYAMNHGDVYVASVAVYSSYSQCLQALHDADKFDGPSVVLAYLPYETEDAPALEVLKETKLAVDAGYWPLYRWDPSKDVPGSEPFSLDSEAVKADLQEFLDRQNHLSQLTLRTPALATELVQNLGDDLRTARKIQAKAAYDELVRAMQSSSPPLLILYASDGGVAEKLSKRLELRAKARGLGTRIAVFDSYSIDTIQKEAREGTIVVFVSSTAGQGEPPQNARDMFKAINAAALKGETPFAAAADDEESALKFAVFGLGDKKYWPRPEDASYYNKPGRDLDARLEQLGGKRIVNLGLGDDQDADGPQTGYKAWEPLLWRALGVGSIEVTEAEPEPITNENIKIASNYLRGTILQGLVDESTGALSASDTQLTKFHGIYEQDDRDIREERKEAGLEPAYSFMIRVRMPGGVCLPHQWLAMDHIADERGNGTFKLTTRQTFQFHGVIKKHLKPTIQGINRALLDTLAACGDVNRNALCSSNPSLSHLHAQVYAFAKACSEHLLPRTSAYHEIWLDKKVVAGGAVKDFEPLYGEFYLPRKFKVAVAVPPNNDVDVFANDVGFIAIADADGKLVGFNVTAGGGMGVTHSNKKTYPRLGDVMGFCTPEQGKYVAEKIMLVQRDNGNRADRKNARLKYTIDRMGPENFKAEVEKLLGYKLQPARPFHFEENVDHFGWSRGFDGKHHFTLFIENGRIQDEPGKAFKSGLREIAQVHKGTIRLTANQHLIISDISDEDLPLIKRLLAKHKLDNLSHSGLRLSSSACVAFPTCGLAMAEAERYLPILVGKVEEIMEENGLRNDSIIMRMTGCPNGCARPYVAEIAFVGKAPGSYLMLLGGGYHGQRLNKIYRESVTEPEILAILRPMIKRYALERLEGERFGDFVIRAGYISATTSGKEWYDRAGGEGEHRVETS